MKHSARYSSFLRRRLAFAAAVVAAAVFLCSAFPAAAEKTPGVTIGIVDMDMIMQNAAAAKHVREQIDKKRTEYQRGLQATEQKLTASQQELIKQQEGMPEEAFREKQQGFHRQVMEAQRTTQTEQRQMDIAVERSLNELRQKTGEIVRVVARQRNIDVVLASHAVIIAASALDITDEVLARLNQEMKTLPVKW